MKPLIVIPLAALILAVSGIAAIALSSQPTEANDIAPFETVFATDAAQFGFGGIRTIGTGTITVSGVSGTVTRALLYWQGPTNSTDPAVNAAVTFGGTDITGTNIGVSSDNCWGFDNSQAYRADVTSVVTGNGAYALANFLKADADINGVSLFVFFDDGNDANNRDVVLFDGNDSNVPGNGFDADGWNVSLPGINYTSGTASMDLHVGDGQGFEDADVVLNAATLASGPDVFQGDSVPNGASAGDTNGGLWDVKSYDVTSALTPGDNTLTLTSAYTNDCLSLIVAAVNLPAGAAPNQPAAITLDPATATNTVGEDHTVTATVRDQGDPQAGVDVTFTITDGPNAGDTATDTTVASGEAAFTYTGDGGVGTDTIEACFVQAAPTPTPTPTATPTPTPTPQPPAIIGQPPAQDQLAVAQQQQEVCATATKIWVAAATPVPSPAALPPTGGQPSGSNGALPWPAVAIGALALMSGAAWLAFQRRHAR